jgi:hypothetical protein
MKTETIYVILEMTGKSFVIKNQDREPVDLNHLLADGWRPVRETSFGGTNPAVLVCLERDREGQMGFGFGH